MDAEKASDQTNETVESIRHSVYLMMFYKQQELIWTSKWRFILRRKLKAECEAYEYVLRAIADIRRESKGNG